jgi:secernin
MTALLERYGQGGTCSDAVGSFWSYHNGFLIADGSEAWVLETLGRHWASEQVTSGVRNISNQLTIRTKIDAMSPGLKDYAKSQGWWNGDGEFDFAKVYSDSFEETELKKNHPPSSRQLWGRKLLEDFSQEGKFGVADMFKILRHEDSEICMTGAFLSTGSQVSLLRPGASGAPSCHWFTATPYPSQSFFKPFIFTDNASIGDKTTSPDFGDKDPVKIKPRFQKQVDRQHALWIAHKKLKQLLDAGDPNGQELLKQIQELEAHCVADMEEVTNNFTDSSKAKVAAIFQHMVDLEINFYK